MTGSVKTTRGMLDTSTLILLGRLADPDELPEECCSMRWPAGVRTASGG
jgi:hypothetical protein